MNCNAMRYRVFLGIFRQIAAALNRCVYCLLERLIQQEKHVPQLKVPEWVKTELNNYTLYRYCTSTAAWQLNTVKHQHTSTATSILTTKSTYRSLTAQRLSERTLHRSKQQLLQRESENVQSHCSFDNIFLIQIPHSLFNKHFFPFMGEKCVHLHKVTDKHKYKCYTPLILALNSFPPP
jgi:hypothetical protein